jgi:hypothetical protein
VAAYAKTNANGQWIERSEHVSLNELFDRMTPVRGMILHLLRDI